uniref:Transmembrane protein 45B n=1 Tax=Podarcis muralis TaxID=64176 RepID=A0A670JVB2_PODMU
MPVGILKARRGHNSTLPTCNSQLWIFRDRLPPMAETEHRHCGLGKTTQLNNCLTLNRILAEQLVPGGPHLSLYDSKAQDWVQLMSWPHMTMYLFYGFSGVADVLVHTSLKLPVGLDRLLLALALFAEGFLFHFHDYKDAALTEHLYHLMSIAVFGAALCASLEVFQRDHTLLELFRASLFILQGSWFWQIGFVLYPPWGGPGWKQEEHGNKNFLTMCFFWHYAIGLLVMADPWTVKSSQRPKEPEFVHRQLSGSHGQHD